jgi:hypothetical protein
MKTNFNLNSILLLAVFVVSLVVQPQSARAHHSIAGQFDMTKTLHVTGVVSKLEWTNPHVYLLLDVKESDGSTVTWKLETLPVAMLRKAGITKQSLVSGEQVSMDIVPARDGSLHWAFILNIKFPDGRQFQFSRDPNGGVVSSK